MQLLERNFRSHFQIGQIAETWGKAGSNNYMEGPGDTFFYMDGDKKFFSLSIREEALTSFRCCNNFLMQPRVKVDDILGNPVEIEFIQIELFSCQCIEIFVKVKGSKIYLLIHAKLKG